MPIWTILGGKGDFSASFIILIVVFSTQLRCGVAGGGMLGPLRDPAPGSIIYSRGLLMSKKKNVEWAIYGPGSMRTPPP